MKKVAIVFSLLGLPVLAAEGTGPYALELRGKAFDERCLKIAAGEVVRYSFRASEPVDFNIHFHRGRDVFFPVRQSAVREVNATFRAESTEDYCLMWEHAGPGTARIDGTLEPIAR